MESLSLQVTLYRLPALLYAMPACVAEAPPSKDGRRGLWPLLAARGCRWQKLIGAQCVVLLLDILCLPLLLILLLSVWRVPSLRRRWAQSVAACPANV